MIRAAGSGDLPILREIEISAGQCFRDVGMAAIADDDPLSLEELAQYQRTGLAWVAVGEADRPVAYLIAKNVDGNLHIEQVSVHAGSARQGIGRSLLDHAAGHAAAAGFPALTLTTFAEVPWNAPYYERCGFRRIDGESITPGLRAIRRHEAAIGLDQWSRICMRRMVSRTPDAHD